MAAYLQDYYRKEIVPALKAQFGFKSVMEVPRIQKITINMGLAEAVSDKKVLTTAMEEMKIIAGQQPVATLARQSIAGFKIREGWPVGCKVTLRKQRMYEFLHRLISIALPRVRDFRGFSSKSFDGQGNFSFGLKEQVVFAEIDYDKVDKMRGMDIIITTSAKNNEEGLALLEAFQFPLVKRKSKKEGA